MNQIVYIGIDDTDTLDSVGTGRVAKGLAGYITGLGLARSLGVSRHQLLVDSRVKYTSHNSSKGLALEMDGEPSDLYEPAVSYLRGCFVAGSDPGLCICPESDINQEILDYAVSCKTRVILKEEAIRLAARYNIFLRELGGDGGGIIGALASVGLRAGGNDGRLVDLRGIKDISGFIMASELKQRTDIVSIQDVDGRELPDEEMIDSLDWVRPSLLGGRPILRVRLASQKEGKNIWQSVEVKHSKKEKKEAPSGQ